MCQENSETAWLVSLLQRAQKFVDGWEGDLSTRMALSDDIYLALGSYGHWYSEGK